MGQQCPETSNKQGDLALGRGVQQPRLTAFGVPLAVATMRLQPIDQLGGRLQQKTSII